MSLPRPSEKAKAAFSGLVPRDSAVSLRPMFGNLAAFVNGNMFAGLFGEDLFVRLPEAERAELKRKGGRDFEPMPGRAMTGYVVVPGAWQRSSAPARTLVEHALTLTRAMPAKDTSRKRPAAAKPKPKPSR
jgi:TfoX/Sxy family transcriptional regulator of competence genes